MKEISLPYRWILFAVNLKKERKMVCELCGEKKDISRELVCHHMVPMKIIKYNIELIFDSENIQVLCHYCHNGIHNYNRIVEDEHTQSEVMKELRKIDKCLKKIIKN